MSEQNQEQPQTQTTATDATQHLRVVVQALQVAARRGAFELDEAGNVQESVKFFSSENNDRSDEKQKEHLQRLVGMTEVAQKRGAFNLAEAHSVYPHVKFFLADPQPIEQQPNESCNKEGCNPDESCNKEGCNLDESCNKEGCNPDECPCPPNNCPCDENNTCQKPNIEHKFEKVHRGVDKEGNWNDY